MSICCDIVHVHVMTRACLFLYEGIKCPSLPQWAGLIISSHSNDIGSHVNATCGHVVGQGQTRFDDTALFKLVTCNSDGEWQPALPACVGKCCPHCLPKHTRTRVYRTCYACQYCFLVAVSEESFSPAPTEAEYAEYIGPALGMTFA